MSFDELVIQTAFEIKSARRIAALTGAGISTNAGIPDFRGPRGLYLTRRYDPEKIFNISAFQDDPEPFYQFARDYLELESRIQPTFTHRFLAWLEQKQRLAGVVTQNIDSLHQMAGMRQVIEIHGSFWTSHCLSCDRAFSFTELKEKMKAEDVPCCVCEGLIKPDIVFFGEEVHGLEQAAQLAESSDLFFVIGTSCVVYPAAMLPNLVDGKVIVVNQGQVDLPEAPVVLSVESDADQFFAAVQEQLRQQGL